MVIALLGRDRICRIVYIIYIVAHTDSAHHGSFREVSPMPCDLITSHTNQLAATVEAIYSVLTGFFRAKNSRSKLAVVWFATCSTSIPLISASCRATHGT